MFILMRLISAVPGAGLLVGLLRYGVVMPLGLVVRLMIFAVMGGMITRGIALSLLLAVMFWARSLHSEPLPARAAGDLRLVFWHSELERKGPGLLAADIISGKDVQVQAVSSVLRALQGDVIVLAGVDWDHDLIAARALAGLVAPDLHLFARRPNTGMASGLDLDGDGRLGGAADAQGWGRFSGQGGLVVLSRLPIAASAARDFSDLLWADLPGSRSPDQGEVRDLQRLSTTAHWQLPIEIAPGRQLQLLIWHASPPAFGAPGGRNAARNHDETAFWAQLLAGALAPLGLAPPEGAVVAMGDANQDPALPGGEAMRALISQLSDPLAGTGPTAFFARPGPLRTDYILPAPGLQVVAGGVIHALPGIDPVLMTQGSRHRPIWLDLRL